MTGRIWHSTISRLGKRRAIPCNWDRRTTPAARQLEAIEKSLADPDSFEGMERQRVSEALIAAKLSRGLRAARIERAAALKQALEQAVPASKERPNNSLEHSPLRMKHILRERGSWRIHLA